MTHSHRPRRPSDRHLGEALAFVLALAVMALAVLLQIGGTR